MRSEAESIEVSDQTRLTANPLVSVLMATYNHEHYLPEAIAGIVSQQCNFAFELIVGEDASTDETLKIALEYQRRYPKIVRVVYAAANVGPNANVRRMFERSRGEFIAYCDGDDYWCSPNKLARQIDLIRSDAQVGIVHADWVRARLKEGVWNFDPNKSEHRRVPLRLLQGNIFSTWHFPKILRTCTVLMRRQTIQELVKSDLGKKEYRFGDSVQSAYVTAQWRVAYLPEVVAVYRVSPNSALRSGAAARVALYRSCLEFDTDARIFFSSRTDYPSGYRWEVSVALLLWAIRARDVGAVKFALQDIRAHFGMFDFIATGWKTVMMRWPTLCRQPRTIPAVIDPPSMPPST